MKKDTLSKFLISLVLLLGNNRGCGDDDDPPPKQPIYQEDPGLTSLKKNVLGRTQELLDIPYEEYLSRFTVPESQMSLDAAGKAGDLLNTDYTPKGYEDYLSRFTPESSSLMTGALDKYQGLFDSEEYGIEDYFQTEQDYLDVVLRKYGEAREESFDPIRERYIGENLYESGPGFQAEREYGEDTAQGVGDITKQWAYEGIQRKQQQEQYQDALKRGDYATMYNLALSEENRTMKPVFQATEMAANEERYYDALERGDMQTAFNIGQILRQNQTQPIAQANQAQQSALSSGLGLYGQISQEDLSRYQIEQQKYQNELSQYNYDQESGGDFGGIGSLLGAGAGIAASFALPGSIGALGYAIPGLIGGTGGGALGSMFKY